MEKHETLIGAQVKKKKKKAIYFKTNIFLSWLKLKESVLYYAFVGEMIYKKFDVGIWNKTFRMAEIVWCQQDFRGEFYFS